MSVELTDDQYLALLLRAKGTPQPRRRFSPGGCIVWIMAGIIFVVTLAVMAPQIAATYPVPVLSRLFVTPQVVVGTPLPTARQVQQQPMGVPAGAPAWPTLTPTAEAAATPAPTPAPTPTPYTVQPNLGPSNPESNPGFSCGVEPGVDPNATCATEGPIDPETVPEANNIYSVDDRVFQPAVLPTSSTADNPGFDSSVEPGSEPTPVR